MKWLHNLLKGASLTGALFVFQACYGTPQNPLYEDGGLAPMDFLLVSHTTGEPLEGIEVNAASLDGREWKLLGTTDADGRCHVDIPYARNMYGPSLFFADPQSHYSPKDTTLTDLREREIVIKLKNVQ